MDRQKSADAKTEFLFYRAEYCARCKRTTRHWAVNAAMVQGTGQDLRCAECGSIPVRQGPGFNAELV